MIINQSVNQLIKSINKAARLTPSTWSIHIDRVTFKAYRKR